MVSGLAPGKLALTEIVGKSTAGSGETGKSRNATAPERATAAVNSVVAIGLRMNGAEIFMRDFDLTLTYAPCESPRPYGRG